MKTVYVGMSGGVDSSVAAGLLKQQGYRVIGVYMQNWTQSVGGVDCPWEKDLADAKASAATLGIPFKVFNFEAEYKHLVVDVMVSEYQSGRTPNPDILCNQDIKFKLFVETALAAGADLVATGHYARITDGKLLSAIDQTKDQSYFLYRINKLALAKTIFPLGELTKTHVRMLAREMGLPTADKPDSQGICFVGEVGIKDFLKQYIDASRGPIVRISDRKIIGEHDGAVFYTIGQRQGLGIGGGQPLYVVHKDMPSNTIFVTDDPNSFSLESSQFNIYDIHWINHEPDTKKHYQIKTRYRSNSTNATLKKTSNGFKVKLESSERAITAGQSAVLYDGDQVIGGGLINDIIPKTRQNNAKTLVNSDS